MQLAFSVGLVLVFKISGIDIGIIFSNSLITFLLNKK